MQAALDFLDGHPDVDVVYGQANHVDAFDRFIERYPTEAWDVRRLAEVCFISQPATFFRRRVVEQHGGLDASFRYSPDYDFWLRLADEGVQFAYLPRLLASTRLHPQAATLAHRVACHAANNTATRRHIGRTPDRWLFQYAHAVLEENGRDRWPRPLSSCAFAGVSLYAAWRWNRSVSTRHAAQAGALDSRRHGPRPDRRPSLVDPRHPRDCRNGDSAALESRARGQRVRLFAQRDWTRSHRARLRAVAASARRPAWPQKRARASPPTRLTTHGSPSSTAPHPYAVNLVCVNPIQHFAVKARLGEELFRDHYNIAVWFWELPLFPAEWYDRFAEYDEIWATSSFIANALTPISPIPVVRVPPVMVPERLGSRTQGRERLGAAPDEVVYLFVFDFASNVRRKNPLATIQAFKRAFAPNAGARLVIKCTNEHMEPAAHQELLDAADGHAVSILTGHWTRDELLDLMSACDVYVSLHRSEGLGLTIAEAMARSKPVIATGLVGQHRLHDRGEQLPRALRAGRACRGQRPVSGGFAVGRALRGPRRRAHAVGFR